MLRAKILGFLGVLAGLFAAIQWIRRDAQDDLLNDIENKARDVRDENRMEEDASDAKIDSLDDDDLARRANKWLHPKA